MGMKLRVLSDLHIDVNQNNPLKLKDNDDFTLIAGDVSGSPSLSIDWIKKNVKQGIVIAGNHIVYNIEAKTIQALKKEMADAFPKESPITFLDQMTGLMHKEVNGILFIGTTLYTDYRLYGSDPEYGMQEAFNPMGGLNDFRFGRTNEGNASRPLRPTDYLRWFIESKKEMIRILDKNKDKDVVVITHHCPHKKCLQDDITRYMELDTSYASDMSDLILKYPNIKLWVAGHVHQRGSFKVGQCLVVQNPMGYEHRYETLGFTPDVFVDTKDWHVQRKPVKLLDDMKWASSIAHMEEKYWTNTR